MSETDAGKQINAFRIKWVLDHAGPRVSLLDYGSGDLTFLSLARLSHWPEAHGYDICEDDLVKYALRDLGHGSHSRHHAVCFWDSLEHLDNPMEALALADAWVFVTIPIMPNSVNPARLPEWKHYKPGEHFWYFTRRGIVSFMREAGFTMTDVSEEECEYGREDIATFAFLRREIK